MKAYQTLDDEGVLVYGVQGSNEENLSGYGNSGSVYCTKTLDDEGLFFYGHDSTEENLSIRPVTTPYSRVMYSVSCDRSTTKCILALLLLLFTP